MVDHVGTNKIENVFIFWAGTSKTQVTKTCLYGWWEVLLSINTYPPTPPKKTLRNITIGNQ